MRRSRAARWRAAPIPGPEVVRPAQRRGAQRRAVVAGALPFAIEEAIVRRQQQLGGRGLAHDRRRALLANDMHLGLRLPNVWYRARLIVERQPGERA